MADFNSTEKLDATVSLEKPSQMFFAIVATTGSVVLVLALVGNFVVLDYYGRAKRRKRSLFIVSLAFIDLIKTIGALWMLSVCAIYQRWVFGHIGCQYYAFWMSFTSICEIVLLASIAVERWRAINCPVEASRTTTKQRLYIVMFAVVSSGLISSFPLLGWGRFGVAGFGIHCGFEFIDRGANVRSYIIFLFSTVFVVPVSTLLFCYGHILFFLRSYVRLCKRNASASADGGRGDYEVAGGRKTIEDSRRERQMKLTMPLLLATVAFLLAWTPFAVVVLISQFGKEDLIGPYSMTFCEVFAKSSVVLNPIVYAFRDKDLVKWVYQRYFQSCCCGSDRCGPFRNNQVDSWNEMTSV